MAASDVEAVLDNYKCGNCHGMSDRKIGPALKAIAARYRGQDVTRQLANNIKGGSVGGWGPIPAPPMRNVSDADAEMMARWILAL
jgi:cytochrome c